VWLRSPSSGPLTEKASVLLFTIYRPGRSSLDARDGPWEVYIRKEKLWLLNWFYTTAHLLSILCWTHAATYLLKASGCGPRMRSPTVMAWLSPKVDRYLHLTPSNAGHFSKKWLSSSTAPDSQQRHTRSAKAIGGRAQRPLTTSKTLHPSRNLARAFRNCTTRTATRYPSHSYGPGLSCK